MEPIKQMSKEEKLEKARELYETANADQRYVLERLFPELIGANADKIKEAVLQYFEEVSRLTFNGFRKDEIIVWLKNREELISDLKNQIESLYAALEKQGEQKETLCDKCKKEHPSHFCQDITALGRCALEKQDEQKPAETEKGANGNEREIPNSVWSEEDEDNFKTLVGILNERMNSCDKGTMTYNVYKNIQDWFKSLKDRYTWKPSERQMKALKDACDEHWEPDGLDPLYVLWEQLKKLKG